MEVDGRTVDRVQRHGRHHPGCELLERREVVQDPEAAAVGASTGDSAIPKTVPAYSTQFGGGEKM